MTDLLLQTHDRGRTLTDLLAFIAETYPEKRCHFVPDGSSMSFARMAADARRMAGGLRGHGVAPATLVGLLVPNSLDFVTAFFGVSAAGCVPTALPLPPSVSDMPAYARRLAHIMADGRIGAVIAHEKFAGLVAESLPGVVVHTVRDLVAAGAVAPPVEVEIDENALAFVQYTSGSTSAPKGVALTHRNVLAGIRAIASGIELGENDVCSLWLPLFHDMGLIGLLTGLAYGVTMYLWPPSVFLRAPAKWLADFARFGTTIYFGPNFSYEYLLTNVTEEELAALDLTPWRVAFNGGEHIDPGCLQRFSGYFSAAGFRPETMFPVYGLAEATLAVTFPVLGSTPRVEHAHAGALANERRFVRVDRLDPAARAVVSVGRPVLDHRVRVVGPDGAALADGTVGEIQIAGPAVMSGYLHRDPREAVDAAGWLATGDLGFVDDGELFVTGRAKEMIVVRGQNYYPQDVEALVRDVAGVNRGRCNAVVMAFPGHEYIALFAESASHTPADADALAETLRVTIERALQIDAVAVYVLKRGSIRRTTSGKYQRTLMGRLLFEGDLDTAMLATRE